MVNSEQLIGTTDLRRNRRRFAQTGVVITGFDCDIVKCTNRGLVGRRKENWEMG
jgi:hypothetical protein